MDAFEQLRILGFGVDMLAEARQYSQAGFRLARVVAEHREIYTVCEGAGETGAEVAGKLRFASASREDFPCVGDWVVIAGDENPVVIHHLFPRRTLLARRAAGDRTELQPIAANMDIVFVMHGLDVRFNARRLERSVVIVRESGATPAILLGKSDLLDHESVGMLVEEAGHVAPDVQVISCSSVSGEGLERIRSIVGPGITGCLIGPSGVGKSRLINTLAGDSFLATGEVRDRDGRGRHTTTVRRMVFLPGGGMLIDTPGMREIGLWHSAADLGDTFPEIGELAEECRFRDCTHRHEPGCAVQLALNEGRLPPDRYESYCKLSDEARSMEERTTVAGRLERKRKEKILSREVGRALKRKGRK
jgi:ribosome biogenesis GTPase / thiamine phosphate phosphatase